MPTRIRRTSQRVRIVEGLVARDGYGCFYCGCAFGAGKRTRTIDHSLPLAAGGTWEISNLRLACSRCNQLKGTMTGETFLGSARLARRRRVVADELALAAGLRASRRMYHHPELTWHEAWVWTCAACGQHGSGPAESPARVVCSSAILRSPRPRPTDPAVAVSCSAR